MPTIPKFSQQQAVTVSRILIGVFFIISGLANYYHFKDADGFYVNVLTMKLKLWGYGFSGIGPLPGPLGAPYAYILPAIEIALGVLFVLGRWTKIVGLLLMGLLASFVLAFGVLGDSLLPNNAPSYNKDIIFMLAIWMIVSYEDNK
jgi:uncharacterized membrane protein YphA (DoxX/SURF4 family)